MSIDCQEIRLTFPQRNRLLGPVPAETEVSLVAEFSHYNLKC